MIINNNKYIFSYKKSIDNIKLISKYLDNSGTHLVKDISINNIWYLKYYKTNIDITRSIINENIENIIDKKMNNKNEDGLNKKEDDSIDVVFFYNEGPRREA